MQGDVLLCWPDTASAVFKQDIWKSPDSEESSRRNLSTVLSWSCVPLVCLPHEVSTSRVWGLHHFAPWEVSGCGDSSSPQWCGGAKGSRHVVKLPQAPESVSPQEVCGLDISRGEQLSKV